MATPGRSVTTEDRSRIARLHASGKTVSEIARQAMVSRPTVRKILEKRR